MKPAHDAKAERAREKKELRRRDPASTELRARPRRLRSRAARPCPGPPSEPGLVVRPRTSRVERRALRLEPLSSRARPRAQAARCAPHRKPRGQASRTRENSPLFLLSGLPSTRSPFRLRSLSIPGFQTGRGFLPRFPATDSLYLKRHGSSRNRPRFLLRPGVGPYQTKGYLARSAGPRRQKSLRDLDLARSRRRSEKKAPRAGPPGSARGASRRGGQPSLGAEEPVGCRIEASMGPGR